MMIIFSSIPIMVSSSPYQTPSRRLLPKKEKVIPRMQLGVEALPTVTQTMEGVLEWLKSERLHKYWPVFSRMNYQTLVGLTESNLDFTLDCIGSEPITNGARGRVLRCTEKLRERSVQLESITHETLLNDVAKIFKTIAKTPLSPSENEPSGICLVRLFRHKVNQVVAFHGPEVVKHEMLKKSLTIYLERREVPEDDKIYITKILENLTLASGCSEPPRRLLVKRTRESTPVYNPSPTPSSSSRSGRRPTTSTSSSTSISTTSTTSTERWSWRRPTTSTSSSTSISTTSTTSTDQWSPLVPNAQHPTFRRPFTPPKSSLASITPPVPKATDFAQPFPEFTQPPPKVLPPLIQSERSKPTAIRLWEMPGIHIPYCYKMPETVPLSSRQDAPTMKPLQSVSNFTETPSFVHTNSKHSTASKHSKCWPETSGGWPDPLDLRAFDKLKISDKLFAASDSIGTTISASVDANKIWGGTENQVMADLNANSSPYWSPFFYCELRKTSRTNRPFF